MELTATAFYEVPPTDEISAVADAFRTGLQEIAPLYGELGQFEVLEKPMTRRVAVKLDLNLDAPNDDYVTELLTAALEVGQQYVLDDAIGSTQPATGRVLLPRGRQLAIA